MTDARGTFEEGQVARTVPDDAKERVTPAEVMMHPSGKFVVRFEPRTQFDRRAEIDATGAHSLVEAFQPGGNGPRSFSIDPTGRFLDRDDAAVERDLSAADRSPNWQAQPCWRQARTVRARCAKFVEV